MTDIETKIHALNVEEAKRLAAHYKEVATRIAEQVEQLQRSGQLLHAAASKLENIATNPYYDVVYGAKAEKEPDLRSAVNLLERMKKRVVTAKLQLLAIQI